MARWIPTASRRRPSTYSNDAEVRLGKLFSRDRSTCRTGGLAGKVGNAGMTEGWSAAEAARFGRQDERAPGSGGGATSGTGGGAARRTAISVMSSRGRSLPQWASTSSTSQEINSFRLRSPRH